MQCSVVIGPGSTRPTHPPPPVLVSNVFSCINSVEDRVILTLIVGGDNVSDSLFDTQSTNVVKIKLSH